MCIWFCIQRLNNVSWMVNSMVIGVFFSPYLGFWDSCVKMTFWKYLFVILRLKWMKSFSWSVNYVLNRLDYGVLVGFTYIDLSRVSVCFLGCWVLIIGSWILVCVLDELMYLGFGRVSAYTHVLEYLFVILCD